MKKLILALLLVASCAANAQQIAGVQAKSYVVMDEHGHVLASKDAETPRPIASITKLFIAEQVYPTLQADRVVEVSAEDLAGRKHGRVRTSMKLTESQLLELSLISSDNQATYALTRAHDFERVITNVNWTAKTRGLDSVTIEEPSGLSENNKASAHDLARYLIHMRDNPVVGISIEPSTSYGNFRSTNPLIGKPGWDFIMSKTGFIRAAGGCLVTAIKVQGRDVFIVLLGSSNTATRWTDLIKIRHFIDDGSFWVGNSKPIKKKRTK